MGCGLRETFCRALFTKRYPTQPERVDPWPSEPQYPARACQRLAKRDLIRMSVDSVYSDLTLKNGAKMALLVMDGLGDIATEATDYKTPLEAANTPNLDALAKDSAMGRLIPAAHGITPGSGPGHLGLFGYDPLEYEVGRASVTGNTDRFTLLFRKPE